MCRNHSHALVTADMGGTLSDGTKVHIAELVNDEFTLEFPLTGEKLIVPSCMTLLLLSPGRAMLSLPPEALMEVLLALSYVWERADDPYMIRTPA